MKLKYSIKIKMIFIYFLFCLFVSNFTLAQIPKNPASEEHYSFKLFFKSISSSNPTVFIGTCDVDKSKIDNDSLYDFFIFTEQKVRLEKTGKRIDLYFKDTTIVEFIDSNKTVHDIVKGRAISHLLKLPFIKYSASTTLDDFASNYNLNSGWEIKITKSETCFSKTIKSHIKGRDDLEVVQEIRWVFSNISKQNTKYEEILTLDNDQTQSLIISFVKELNK
jgi:hypothetical protein